MVKFTNWTGICICVKTVFTNSIFTYFCKTSVPWTTIIFWRKHTVHPSEMFKAYSLKDIWGVNAVSFPQPLRIVVPLIILLNHGQKVRQCTVGKITAWSKADKKIASGMD